MSNDVAGSVVVELAVLDDGDSAVNRPAKVRITERRVALEDTAADGGLRAATHIDRATAACASLTAHLFVVRGSVLEGQAFDHKGANVPAAQYPPLELGVEDGGLGAGLAVKRQTWLGDCEHRERSGSFRGPAVVPGARRTSSPAWAESMPACTVGASPLLSGLMYHVRASAEALRMRATRNPSGMFLRTTCFNFASDPDLASSICSKRRISSVQRRR